MFFCGEFEHSIDEKHRIVVPAKFRNFIKGEDREGFYLLVSPAPDETCLRLYTPTGWRRQVSRIRKEAMKTDNPAQFYRLYASQAEFVPADSQMRVVLPTRRLEQAGLGRDLLLVGNFEWIEIWDPQQYARAQEQLREKYSGNLGQSLMPDDFAGEAESTP